MAFNYFRASIHKYGQPIFWFLDIFRTFDITAFSLAVECPWDILTNEFSKNTQFALHLWGLWPRNSTECGKIRLAPDYKKIHMPISLQPLALLATWSAYCMNVLLYCCPVVCNQQLIYDRRRNNYENPICPPLLRYKNTVTTYGTESLTQYSVQVGCRVFLRCFS